MLDHCEVSLKVRYASPSDARAALSKVATRRNTHDVERSAYHCPHCRGWHITRFHSRETKPRNTRHPYVRPPRLRLIDY